MPAQNRKVLCKKSQNECYLINLILLRKHLINTLLALIDEIEKFVNVFLWHGTNITSFLKIFNSGDGFINILG